MDLVLCYCNKKYMYPFFKGTYGLCDSATMVLEKYGFFLQPDAIRKLELIRSMYCQDQCPLTLNFKKYCAHLDESDKAKLISLSETFNNNNLYTVYDDVLFVAKVIFEQHNYHSIEKQVTLDYCVLSVYPRDIAFQNIMRLQKINNKQFYLSTLVLDLMNFLEAYTIHMSESESTSLKQILLHHLKHNQSTLSRCRNEENIEYCNLEPCNYWKEVVFFSKIRNQYLQSSQTYEQLRVMYKRRLISKAERDELQKKNSKPISEK